MAVCLALLASACGAGDEAVVSGGLDLSRALADGEQSASGSENQNADTDDLALRSGGESGSDSGAGSISGAGSESALPSPPTLSPAAATESAAAPVEATTTTAPAPVSSTSPTSMGTTAATQPSTTTSVPAPAAKDSTVTPAGPAAVDPDPTPSTSSPATAPADGGDLASGEGHSFNRLNELRSSLGLSGLARDGEMDAFARNWSRQMAETGDFRHSDGPYGENIAFTSNTQLSASEAADLFHQLWLDSPGHYANMTNGGYVKSGVGLYRTERGWYGTHVFSF